MNITTTELKDKLIELLDNQGIKVSEIDNDANLVEEGILDSIAFLGFIMKLEGDFGLELDFSELDPTEFTSLNKLNQLVNQ